MPNINSSLTLNTAARSDPRDVRLIFQWYENNQCHVQVQDCFDIGPLTFEINGDATEILCTNLSTGESEVVGTIDGGGSRKATFDLSRYLPQDYLSWFMELVRRNCGLRMYIARGNECLDPFDVNEFNVLWAFGEITFGNYTLTDLRAKDKSEAAAIMEGSTVTAYDFKQIGIQSLASRGELHDQPIVAGALCDKKSCGGQCTDDSDGCQKWFTVDALGQVSFTTDQYFTEALVPNVPTLDGGAITDICCLRGQLVLLEAGGATTPGRIHIADIDTILAGDTPTWTTVSIDSTGTDIEALNACHIDPGLFHLWMVGNNGTIYQYSATLGTITPVPGVPGLIVNYQDIDILGDTILIGGDNDVLIRSNDGGRSFQLIEVIDPLTGIQTAGLTFNAVSVLSKQNLSVGTSDGRVLYTLDDGITWFSQVVPNVGSPITDLTFDLNGVGFLTREDGTLFKTYYWNCEPWQPMPESTDPIPENNGLERVIVCPEDPNVMIAVGEGPTGAGLILLGTSEYA